MVIILTVFMLATGSFLLIFSYIYSSVFARLGCDNIDLTNYENSKFIYNYSGIKLCADFELKNSTRAIAVFYVGHDNINIDYFKKFYSEKNISIVTIYASGCGKSGGKRRQTEEVLKSDLNLWLDYLKTIIGTNCKVILHGFADTALSTFLCASNNTYGIVLDSTHIYPPYLFKNIKCKLLNIFLKRKYRVKISGTKNIAFICSPENLSRDSYKIYEHCYGDKTIYIYEKLDYDNFSKKLDTFITRLKLPEELT